MIPFTIGRENEQHKLAAALKSNKAELIALYGRRRVGKTHLIKHVIDQYSDAAINFEITGKKDGSLKDQIKIFVRAIEKALKSAFPIQPPDNWFDAFDMLTKIFAKLPKNKLIILFFDELPWLATQKSGLLEALDHFWNTEWNYLSKLKLIVCGSAASWILDNLINAKGGLHNRLTSIIPLRPFKIKEARDFLKKNKIKLNDKQILDLYMVMGGIPFYLDGVEKGYSAIQNINNLCFTADGLLFKEFDRLYASLFDKSEAHIEIIKAIAKYHYGIEQNALLAKLKFSSSGGTFTKRLKELEEAGFIISFTPYGHSKKGTYYRIIDECTLFYLKWIQPASNQIKLVTKQTHYWQSKSQTPAWNNWSGYAFEAFCYKHIDEVIQALDIHVGYEIGTWRYVAKNADETGTQIDLLLDRDDGIINVIEIKYSDKPFRITKQYATQLWDKIDIFKAQTKTTKQIFLTMVTTAGLLANTYADELVENEVTLKDFFKN